MDVDPGNHLDVACGYEGYFERNGRRRQSGLTLQSASANHFGVGGRARSAEDVGEHQVLVLPSDGTSEPATSRKRIQARDQISLLLERLERCLNIGIVNTHRLQLRMRVLVAFQENPGGKVGRNRPVIASCARHKQTKRTVSDRRPSGFV
jgi:hypothetical protein